VTVSPRVDLAGRLADAGPPELTVFAEEPIQAPALPAMVVRPGAPYREEGEIPSCSERWRLEVVALVPIDAVAPLDELDPLITLARDVIRAMDGTKYNGVRAAPASVTIAGKSMRGAVIELDVDIEED
jgi:hypothetical protein